MAQLSHVHVYEPPQPGSSTTLLLLHGTGGDERQLLGVGRALDRTAGLLGVRGATTEGGMPRFFRRIPTSGPEGGAYGFVIDAEDARRRAADLGVFVGDAAQAYGFDPTGVVAVGFSNGANVGAAMLLGAAPEVLRAAVLFAPMVPFAPASRLSLSELAVLLVGGRRDAIATPAHVERLATLLYDAGAAVQVRWHDGGHDLGPQQVEVAREWLLRWRAATAADPASSPP